MSLPSPELQQVSLDILTPHPLNTSIYGKNEDLSSLIELIQDSSWVKVLVVTTDYVTVSGHRRWQAVNQLGWEVIAVEVRKFPTSIAILEALLLENATRVKTTERKVREAKAWKEVERIKAKDRQGTRTDIQENFPRCNSGRVCDQVACRVGLGSGRTYSKAAKIVTQIDEEASLGHLEVGKVLRKVRTRAECRCRSHPAQKITSRTRCNCQPDNQRRSQID